MDIKTLNTNNKNNLDGEIGAFEKFEIELKNNIFGVVFAILKEQELSIYLCFGVGIVMLLELLIFPFHPTISMVWNSPHIVEVIQRITNFINIVTYMEGTNWTLYISFFYIGIFTVGFTLLLIVYIGYAFSRKRSLSGIAMILRYLTQSLNSTLFIPFLDYFVSVVACVHNQRNNILVHSYFSEVECWNGIHIVHSIVAIVAIIVLIIVSNMIALTCFEYRNISNDASCRVNARTLFYLLSYQIIMVICLTFLTDEAFQVLLLGLIFIGSVVLFMKYYYSFHFHNELVSKLWSTITAINLWTAVMLVFAKVMENNLFEGSIIAWLVGIPFVIFIMLITRDPRINLLLINVNKVQNPKEVQDQIKYIMKLIDWQMANKNSAVLLDGYIEIHKQNCSKEDCPLKQKAIKNNRFAKNLMKEDDTINEKYARLIHLIYKMYLDGLRKFPNDTSLRISYAIFLLDKMQSKQQALQELSQAEQNKPPFDEQFIIFRYKKIIEDEIAESQNDGQGGLDVVSEVSFQNHLRQLQASIEKSALLHMEFWSQLSEDNPDLAKLNDIGSKINSSVHNVDEQWNKLLKINASNAKAMRLYGKYMIEIINDKETGDGLLEKARNLSNVQATRRVIQMIGAGDESSNDATPIVWVSGEQEKFGMITGINLSAASLFGYSKIELLNRKVNSLMPQVFAKYHDSFLENYINSGEGTFAGKNKERFVFGKNKSQYIFPIYISVKAIQSILQGIQFIATFRIEKNFRNTAYVLTQADGTIDSISSSSINILKIDLKSITQKKGNIQDFIPNIIQDRQTMFSINNNTTGKSSTVIQYRYPEDSDYLSDDGELSVQLNCQLFDITFLGGKENAGLQFRFERTLEKPSIFPNTEKKAKISNFQFRFDRSRPVIVGEYVEGNSTNDFQSDDIMLGGVQNTENSDNSPESAKNIQEDFTEIPKKNYAVGIKTLRLVDGRPQEIVDDKEEDDDDDEAESSLKEQSHQNLQKKEHQRLQQEEDLQDEDSLKDFSTAFKSRKALTAVINDRTPPSSIKSLRYIANFLGLVLLLIAMLDYIFASNEYDKINTQIDLLDKSNLQIAELMTSLSKIRELYLINMKLLDDIYTNTTLIKESLRNSLETAKNLKEQLELKNSMLSTDHFALLNQPMVQIVGVGSAITKKGLTQATEEVISRAFDLSSRDVADINENNTDYYYVTYNLLNDFYKGLKDSSQFYAIELIDNVQKQEDTFLILLAASIAGMLVAILVFFPILYQVNKTREEILSMFLDIPEKTVKGLYSKCETFVSNLQVGEDEDLLSEIDEEELEKQLAEDDNHEYIPRRRRKRFKNSGRNQRSFFIKVLTVTSILESYFLYTYISSKVLLENVLILIPELNATSVAEPFFSFANNAQKQLFINSAFTILGSDPEEIVNSNVKSLYDLDSLVLEEHSFNRKTHSEEYANVFNQIMMTNPCPLLVNYVSTNSCSTFADQTVSQRYIDNYQGMTVALSRHFENLRTLFTCYSKKKIGQNCTFQPTITKAVDTTNYTRNQILNLMRTNQSVETDRMQSLYIKQTFRNLMRDFKTSLRESFDDTLTIKLIIFILYIIIVVSVYLILWQTLIRKISNDIWRTKSMLNMIPLNVIAKIRSIRLYLKKFWNDRKLSEI